MVSVVICTYNRAASLVETLHSIERMQVPEDLSWELVVVDNNSDDDTAEVVKGFAASSCLNVRYIFEKRQGLSNARNRGITESAGEIVVFTDDDVTVGPSWLQEVSETFRRFDCLAMGGRIVPLWQVARPKWFYEGKPYSLSGAIVEYDLGPETRETSVVPFGANMAFRRQAFLRYGNFRPDLGRTKGSLMVGEDTEMFRRLLRGNEKIVYNAQAMVYHPVIKERMRKEYFERWYFNYGKAEARMNHGETKMVCYLGIPRYILRTAAESLVSWLFTAESSRRFQRKLKVCALFGHISASFRWPVLGGQDQAVGGGAAQ